MPTKFEIPARRETHCEPCKYHKMFSAMMGGPGNVWRDYNCMHPDAHDFGPLPDKPELAAKAGELRAHLAEHGRHIGKTDLQPDWCPLRKQAK